MSRILLNFMTLVPIKKHISSRGVSLRTLLAFAFLWKVVLIYLDKHYPTVLSMITGMFYSALSNKVAISDMWLLITRNVASEK